MAFRYSSASAAVAAPSRETWQADGFMNIDLPSGDGFSKLGAIPLRLDVSPEIIEAFENDHDAMAEWVKQNMRITYRSATKQKKGFVVPKFKK